jgi:hypothetical protein
MAHADAKLLDASSRTVIHSWPRARSAAGRDARSCPAPDRPEECASRRIVSDFAGWEPRIAPHRTSRTEEPVSNVHEISLAGTLSVSHHQVRL